MSGSVWYISFSKKKIEFKKYPKNKKNKNKNKEKNKKNNKIKSFTNSILLLAFFFFFSTLVSAAPINDTFHINLQTTYANGSIQTGTFNFMFNITGSSDPNCLNPVYSYSTQLTTDARGIVSIYLPQIGNGGGNLSNLNYDQQYYLCYYRDSTLKEVSQLGRVPYSFRATQVNLSEVIPNSNLTLGIYNVSANWFFGNLNFSNVQNVPPFLLWDNAVNGTLYLSSNPFGFYNATTLPGGGITWANALNGTLVQNTTLGTYLANYYPLNNPFSFYNSTNPPPAGSVTWANVVNGTVYLSSNPSGFYNATTLQNLSQLVNNFNYYNSTTIPAYATWANVVNGTVVQNSTLTNYLGNYYLTSNPSGFYNSTSLQNLSQLANTLNYINQTYANQTYTLNSSLAGYITNYGYINWANAVNGTLVQNSTLGTYLGNYYGIGNSFGFYNSTTLQNQSQLNNNLNYINQTYANQTYTINSSLAGYITNYGYSTWANVVNGTVYLSSNPSGFYNATTLQNVSQLANNVNYYNSTTLQNISQLTNNFGYINQTYANQTYTVNNSLAGYITNYGYITWPNAVNGTLATWNQVMNGTIPQWANVVNGTVYLSSNPFSFYNSTTIPAYATWANVVNGTVVQNSTLTNYLGNYYLTSNPSGFYNSTTLQNQSQLTNNFGYINQTYGNATYLKIENSGNLNVNSSNNSNNLGGYAPSFFMPLNTSVYGNFDFNKGWQNGGVSISGGNIFAQAGYFVNISSLNLTNINTNGSITPIFDNQFDIGSSSLRYRNLYLGGNANVTGIVYSLNDALPTWANVTNGTLVKNTTLTTYLGNYYLTSNPSGFYNSTTLQNQSQLNNNFNYINQTYANQTYTVNSSLAGYITNYGYSTWANVVNGTVYLSSNPSGFYNATTLQNVSQLSNNLNYYNSTTLQNLSQLTNNFGYINQTYANQTYTINSSLAGYITNYGYSTWANVVNGTVVQNSTLTNYLGNYYLTSNPSSFYNSTTLQNVSQLSNNLNYYNSTTLQNISQLTNNFGYINQTYANQTYTINSSLAGYITNYGYITWPNAVNGTLATWNQVMNGTIPQWSNIVNGTIWGQVVNGTVVKNTTLTTYLGNYYLTSNPSSFYNSTTLQNVSQLSNNLNYYNSTTLQNLSQLTNNFGYINQTYANQTYTINSSLAGYITNYGYSTWANVVNGTVYLSSNPSGFYNATTLQNVSQLANNLNYYNSTTLQNISQLTNNFGYINQTYANQTYTINSSLAGYITNYGYINWANAVNGTLVTNSTLGNYLGNYYPLTNPFGFINTTTNFTSGSGIYGYIPMWNGTNSLNSSRIYQNGSNIGIGITNPNQALEVSGNIYASNFKFNDTNNSILIGTSTGSNLLGVTGLGYQAAYGNTGSYLAALGYQAGYQNNASLVTAIGNNAGYLNSGGSTTSVGASAGFNNSGSSSTFLGYSAGIQNKGSGAIALGFSSGNNNSGAYLTAIGVGAGNSNSGSNVVAIGYEAGQNNSLSNQFIVQEANINSIPLIQGDFASGYLGINTTSPQNTLNVLGTLNVTGAAYFPSTGCPAGQVLTADITTGQLKCVTDQTLGGGAVTGAGNTGYIPLWNGTSSINNSNIYQNSVGIGINTSTPQNTLNVVGNANITGTIYSNNQLLPTWANITNGTIYLSSNPSGFYNSTTLQNQSQLNNNFGYINQTYANQTYTVNSSLAGYITNYGYINWANAVNGTLVTNSTLGNYLGNYYTTNNPFSFYNSTNPPPASGVTWANVVNGTVYLSSNPFSFYNSTTIPAYATWANVVNGTVVQNSTLTNYLGNYYLTSNPSSFYNSTTLQNVSQLANNLNYYNSTTLQNLSQLTNSFGYINQTYANQTYTINSSLAGYITNYGYSTWANVVNGTVYLSSNPSSFYNSTTLQNVSQLANNLNYYNSTTLQNLSQLTNNFGYINQTYANQTYTINSSLAGYITNYGYINWANAVNGTLVTNSTLGNYLGNYYGTGNNFGFYNSTTLQNQSQLNNNFGYINQTYGNATYLKIENTGNLNVNSSNNSNNLGGYAPSFFMPLNTSVYGNFDFNKGWQNGGVSISGGNIFAQTGYFVNISSLNVTNVNTNASIAPTFDNQFDLGSASFRYRNLYLGGNANVTGIVYSLNDALPTWTNVTNGTLVKNTTLTTYLGNYYLTSNPSGFYNSTTLQNQSQLNNNFNYINQTYANQTYTVNSSLAGYITNYGYSTWANVVNGTVYLSSNPSSFYNSTTLQNVSQLANNLNYYNSTTLQNLSQLTNSFGYINQTYANQTYTINSSLAGYITNYGYITWPNAVNGTLATWNQVMNGTIPQWSNIVNGTIWGQVVNGTVVKNTTLTTYLGNYYLTSNPSSFYNSTTLQNVSQLANNLNYYNSTTLQNLSQLTNNFGYINQTYANQTYTVNNSLAGYITNYGYSTWANVVNGTVYLSSNPSSFYNSTTLQNVSQLANNLNYYNSTTLQNLSQLTNNFGYINQTYANQTYTVNNSLAGYITNYGYSTWANVVNGTVYLSSNPSSFYNSTTLQNVSQLANNLNYYNSTTLQNLSQLTNNFGYINQTYANQTYTVNNSLAGYITNYGYSTWANVVNGTVYLSSNPSSFYNSTTLQNVSQLANNLNYYNSTTLQNLSQLTNNFGYINQTYANQTYTVNNSLAGYITNYGYSTWANVVNGTVYLSSNPSSFYNSTTLQNVSQLANNLNYYNSTTLQNLSQLTNNFGYINQTYANQTYTVNNSLAGYITNYGYSTWANVVNGTVYLSSNPSSFYNSTTLQNVSQLANNLNYYNSTTLQNLSQLTNNFGYINQTYANQTYTVNNSLAGYITNYGYITWPNAVNGTLATWNQVMNGTIPQWSNVVNGTVYLSSNPFGFYNSTGHSTWDINVTNGYLNVTNQTGVSLLYAGANGNVGINTNTPQNTFNVVGNANITGIVYSLNDVLPTWANVTNGTLVKNTTLTTYLGNYYLTSNPSSFYNSTTLQNVSQLANNLNYYNSTTLQNLSQLTNSFGYINQTYANQTYTINSSLAGYITNYGYSTWANVVNGTVVQNSTLTNYLGNYYLTSNPSSFYNSTTLQNVSQLANNLNYYNSTTLQNLSQLTNSFGYINQTYANQTYTINSSLAGYITNYGYINWANAVNGTLVTNSTLGNYLGNYYGTGNNFGFYNSTTLQNQSQLTNNFGYINQTYANQTYTVNSSLAGYITNYGYITWPNAVNGTLATWNQVMNGTIPQWSNIVNGTIWGQVVNGTVVKNTTLTTYLGNYYLTSNPSSFYNSTTLQNVSQLANNVNYYNSTTLQNISQLTNNFGYINQTYANQTYTINSSLAGYITNYGYSTWANVINGTVYLSSNPSGFYNSTGHSTWDINVTNGYLNVTNQTGVSLLYAGANGNVGINTTSPQNTFNVLGSLNVTGSVYFPSTGCPAGQVLTADATTGQLKCVTDQTLGGGAVTGAGSSGYIPLWNGTSSINNSNIYQNSVGIGINTNTPQNTLNVVGNANVTGIVYSLNDALPTWTNVTNGTLVKNTTLTTYLGNYYLNSNPSGFYNSTTLQNQSQLTNNFGYINQTYANQTYTVNSSLAGYITNYGYTTWANVVNGTVATWANAVNGTLANTTTVNSIGNFSANYSTFLTHITWANAVNGTLVTNSTLGNYLGNYYGTGNSFGFYNSTTLQNQSQLTNNFGYINQTYGNATYLKIENTGNLNVNSSNNSNNLGGYAPSFFMPLNTSVYGNFDFNKGWQNGGVSISGGNIFAQTGYFVNISSLNVTNVNTNASIAPTFDNQFDLGSASFRYRNLYLGGNANVTGIVYSLNDALPTWTNVTNGTLVKNTTLTTYLGNYYLTSNPSGFYNSTTLQNQSQLNNNFNYINQTYANQTYTINSSLAGYITNYGYINWANAVNGTLVTNSTLGNYLGNYYGTGNNFGFYNSTTLQNISQLTNNFGYINQTYANQTYTINSSLAGYITNYGYITWPNAVNGTLATWNQVMNGTVDQWSNVVNGTIWGQVVNGTLVKNTTLTTYLGNYYLTSNPSSFYNSTTLQNVSQLANNLNYYNSTTLQNLSQLTNNFGYINQTYANQTYTVNNSLAGYITNYGYSTWANVVNGTVVQNSTLTNYLGNYYLTSNPSSFYNSTTLQNVSQLANNLNYYNSTTLQNLSQLTNSFGYINQTYANQTYTINSSLAGYITNYGYINWANALNGTLVQNTSLTNYLANYYGLGNSFGFYNSTTLQNLSQLTNNFGYINQTYANQTYTINSSLAGYITNYGYINWANAVNGTLATWNQVMNGTVVKNTTLTNYLANEYDITNPYGYINSTTNPGISGSGTAGYIPMWNGTNSLNNSNIYQNGSKIGINTSTPQNTLNVVGDLNVTQTAYIGNSKIYTDNGGNMVFRV